MLIFVCVRFLRNRNPTWIEVHPILHSSSVQQSPKHKQLLLENKRTDRFAWFIDTQVFFPSCQYELNLERSITQNRDGVALSTLAEGRGDYCFVFNSNSIYVDGILNIVCTCYCCSGTEELSIWIAQSGAHYIAVREVVCSNPVGMTIIIFSFFLRLASFHVNYLLLVFVFFCKAFEREFQHPPLVCKIRTATGRENAVPGISTLSLEVGFPNR